jgi:hypothetical protein
MTGEAENKTDMTKKGAGVPVAVPMDQAEKPAIGGTA